MNVSRHHYNKSRMGLQLFLSCVPLYMYILVTRQTAFPYSVIIFLLLKIAELTVKYAELEEKLLEMRAKSRAEAERFFDEEIDCRLDIISRQVARIDTRLFTYHEVIIRIIQRFTFLYLIHKYKYILTVCCYCLSHKT